MGFSQDKYGAKIPAAEVQALDKRVQDAGTEVVNAKDGKGSATLSMAYAGARLGKAVLAGLAGTPTTECAYVVSDGVSSLPYFTTKVTFGPKGIEKVHPIGTLNEYEQKRLKEAEAHSRAKSTRVSSTPRRSNDTSFGAQARRLPLQSFSKLLVTRHVDSDGAVAIPSRFWL